MHTTNRLDRQCRSTFLIGLFSSPVHYWLTFLIGLNSVINLHSRSTRLSLSTFDPHSWTNPICDIYTQSGSTWSTWSTWSIHIQSTFVMGRISGIDPQLWSALTIVWISVDQQSRSTESVIWIHICDWSDQSFRCTLLIVWIGYVDLHSSLLSSVVLFIID